MTVKRVAIKTDLRVKANDLIVFGHHQRVDLEQAHVLRREGGIKLWQNCFDLLREIARQLERLCNAPAMMRHDTGCRVDREGENFFGRLVGDLLHVHTAFRGYSKGHAQSLATTQRRQINFRRNARPLLNIKSVDLLPLRTGWVRDEGRAEDTCGFFFYVTDGLDAFDPAALAATAGMN